MNQSRVKYTVISIAMLIVFMVFGFVGYAVLKVTGNLGFNHNAVYTNYSNNMIIRFDTNGVVEVQKDGVKSEFPYEVVTKDELVFSNGGTEYKIKESDGYIQVSSEKIDPVLLKYAGLSYRTTKYNIVRFEY